MVARSRRVAARFAKRLGTPATVATVQPVRTDVYAELASFQAAGRRPDTRVDRLVAGGSDTRSIGKGVCAAMLGNAVTLVQ